MPQISINSSNIGVFGWSASFDIYNRSVTFNLLPFTTGSGLGNTKVGFSVVDQDGVTLASIDFTNPQISNPSTTTSWVLDLSNVNFPFLFQTYKIIGAIQDAGGLVYQTDPIYPNICQPSNLTDQGFVPGMFQILPDCVNSVLTVKEITLMVYNSLQPSSVSKSGNLYYPTGTIGPVAFTLTPFSNNVVYSGEYRAQCTSVSTYSLGQDIYVLVSYITNNVFPVTCANKMADVLCCIQKIQQTAIKNCNNAIGENAKNQLSDISVYVMNGLLKEISGQDAQFEVDYIKKYLACDCGSASLSQSEFTPINPAATSIVLTGVGGTTVSSPTLVGNTLHYSIGSNVYQVVKGDTGDLAFTITLNNSIANTAQYVITFDYDTMAGYILTAIQNDPSLLSQLNSLVSSSGSILGLDGSCVIDTTETSYSLSQSYTSSTLIVSVTINGVIHAAPANLFANNPTAAAVWLNSLSLGTFSASVMGSVLTILSPDNTNSVATMTFSSPDTTVQFQATNATLVQVLQAIINYLCGLTDLQIALANNLTLCTLDYNNIVVTTSYLEGTKQSVYNSGISNAICNLTGRISSLTAFTCAKLQALFSDNPLLSFNNLSDRFLSIMGGGCITMTSKQAALAIIGAINSDDATKAAFCAIDCLAPSTCPDVSGVNTGIVNNTTLGVFGITWGSIPSASQTVSVSYRIHGSSVWQLSTNSLLISPNGNISGTSPYQIPGLVSGVTYDIWVQNNCGGNGFVTQQSTPTGSVYTTQVRLDNSVSSICDNSTVNVYSSVPFAVGVSLFSDVGMTVAVVGFSYVALNSGGVVYNLSSSTGVVGSPTGNVCGSGSPSPYILGNSTGSICSGSPVTLYTSGAFAVGSVLYNDSALSSPVTGDSYVVQLATNIIYNLNSTNGTVGSSTGLSCSATNVTINMGSLAGTQLQNVVGIAGFASTPPFPLNPGSSSSGTHTAFTGSIQVVMSGTPTFGGNASLVVNGTLVQCLNIHSGGTFTFSSRAYAGTDVIQVNVGGGSC